MSNSEGIAIYRESGLSSPAGAHTALKRILMVLVAVLALFSLGPVARADYGKCGFDSDCHAGVKCSSGKCADSAGSSCGFDSDCGGHGAKCNSGKCSTAPDGKCNFDSECGGRSCSSGHCK